MDEAEREKLDRKLEPIDEVKEQDGDWVPTWWYGNEEAAQTTMQAARFMRN